MLLLRPQLPGVTQHIVNYMLNENCVQHSRTKSMSCSNPHEKVAICFYKCSPICSAILPIFKLSPESCNIVLQMFTPRQPFESSISPIFKSSGSCNLCLQMFTLLQPFASSISKIFKSSQGSCNSLLQMFTLLQPLSSQRNLSGSSFLSF